MRFFGPRRAPLTERTIVGSELADLGVLLGSLCDACADVMMLMVADFLVIASSRCYPAIVFVSSIDELQGKQIVERMGRTLGNPSVARKDH